MFHNISVIYDLGTPQCALRADPILAYGSASHPFHEVSSPRTAAAFGLLIDVYLFVHTSVEFHTLIWLL